MPRYIDVDALEKEAGKLWSEMPDGEELSKELMKAIKHAPTIDAAPVKHGKWFDAMVGELPVQVCDQCITFFPLAYTGGGHHYCPNCGAKMDLEEEPNGTDNP